VINASILILDFDGLLVDSAPECWIRCKEASKMDDSLDDIYDSNEKKYIFLKTRYLVGPAHEFYYLIKALQKSSSTYEVEEKFYKLLNSNNTSAQRFKDFFFKSRLEAQEKNEKKWIESNNFFYPALSMAKRFAEVDRLYIASMKDEESVLKLLIHHKIKCNKSKVLGRTYGDDKYNHVSHIISKYPLINKKYFLFMDDNLRHIKEVTSLGIESRLVTWGYASNLSIKNALKNNFKTIHLSDCSNVQFK